MRTDLGSLLAIGVGAVGGVALTAAFFKDRPGSVHLDIHMHGKHEVVWITDHKVELEHDLVVEPRVEILMSGPETVETGWEDRRVRVRVEPRVRTERRR